VAAVGDATALLAAVAEDQPDVAIVDVRMPPIALTRDCRLRW
jgi:CheY-like chemotaxis protein